MYDYTWIQWLFFFFFYCFFGWCFESTYVSIRQKRFVNRGFIRGPFLPLYGSGAIVLLVVSKPFQHNWFLTFLAGCIGATILEYVTGVCMEKLFKVRYWDYSDQKLNFQGQICLSSTLAWGGLTLLMSKLIHVWVEKFVLWLPYWLVSVVAISTAIYFMVDFTLSFKAALDLRDVLVKMDKAKHELTLMQKRLDVLMAFAGDDLEREKQKVAEGLNKTGARMDELGSAIGERLQGLKTLVLENQVSREVAEELLEMQSKIMAMGKLQKMSGTNRRRNKILRANPSISSPKYQDALDALKDHLKK